MRFCALSDFCRLFQGDAQKAIISLSCRFPPQRCLPGLQAPRSLCHDARLPPFALPRLALETLAVCPLAHSGGVIGDSGKPDAIRASPSGEGAVKIPFLRSTQKVVPGLLSPLMRGKFCRNV